MSGPDIKNKIPVLRESAGLADVRLEGDRGDRVNVTNNAQMEALRIPTQIGVNDGFGSFIREIENLVQRDRGSLIKRVRRFFADYPPKITLTNTENRIRDYAELVRVPVEKANPLAGAAYAYFMAHYPGMMVAPQIIGAATMLSTVTGMPAGLFGVHI